MSKVGRNDPCPCGSGKKFKKCCESKIEEDKLTSLYGESWKDTDLDKFKDLGPSAVIDEYLKAFKSEDYGVMYDFHTDDSPLKKKKPSKLEFIGEQKAKFNPKYFELQESNILKTKEEGEKAEVIHRADIKIGEDEEIALLENYIMVKTGGQWKIVGTQQKIFGDSEQSKSGDSRGWKESLDWKERFGGRDKREPKSKIPEDLDFSFFKDLAIN